METPAGTLTLLADRAAWLAGEATLFVSDLHLGKEIAFAAQGVPLPHGPTANTLGRLTKLAQQLEARRVVVVGDLWHHPRGTPASLLKEVATWAQQHSGVEWVLVEGNHDRKSAQAPEGWVNSGANYRLGGLAAVHDPADAHGNDFHVLGHLHPGYVLEGKGASRLRLPCFWLPASGVVLPAFGDFTGLSPIQPVPGDRVAVIAGDQVRWVPVAW